MKKFIILTAFICGFLVSNAQSYTYIAQRYDWLAGLFRALGLPAGDSAQFQAGQRMRAGSAYYDSVETVGSPKGLYLWNGLAWELLTAGGGSQTLQQVFDTEPGGSVLTKEDSVLMGGNGLTFFNGRFGVGTPANSLFRVGQGSSSFLVIDPANNQYYIGDANGFGNSTYMDINDGTQNIDFNVGGLMRWNGNRLAVLSDISMTNTGTSGNATYNPVTGVINVPDYSGGASIWSGVVIGTTFSATNATINSGAVQWTFTGSSPATFTLPARTSSVNQFYIIKNIGSADLTIAAAGTDDIYTTSSVTSVTVSPGGSIMITGAANGTSDLWTALFYSTGSGGSTSNNSVTVATYADLDTIATAKIAVVTNSVYGGTFVADPTVTMTANNYGVIRSGGTQKWRRVYSGPLYIEWWNPSVTKAANSSTEIQYAIDYANLLNSNLAAKGSSIFLVDSLIFHLQSDFVFNANGATFVLSASQNAAYAMKISNMHESIFENINLIGTGDTSSTVVAGQGRLMYISAQTGRTTVQNCTFRDFTENAIVVDTSRGSAPIAQGVRILNCNFLEQTYDASSTDQYAVDFNARGEYSTVDNSYGSQIVGLVRVKDGANITISNNIVEQPNGQTSAADYTRAIIFIDSVLSNNGGKTRIIGNRLNHIDKFHIPLIIRGNINPAVENHTFASEVINNHFLSNGGGRPQIYLKNQNAVLISGNNIRAGTNSGVAVTIEGSLKVKITNNTLFDGTYGVKLDSASTAYSYGNSYFDMITGTTQVLNGSTLLGPDSALARLNVSNSGVDGPATLDPITQTLNIPVYAGASEDDVKISFMTAQANINTVTQVGQTSTGTIATTTAVAVTNTNYFTSQPRIHYSSSSTAGNSVSFRSLNGMAIRSGGFKVTIRFGIQATGTASRGAFGLSTNNAAFANADPSALTNFIGVIYDAGQTNFRLATNDGSGAATTIDLGSDYPTNTSATDFYQLTLSQSYGASTMDWVLKRYNSTGSVFDTSGTVSSDLPITTSALYPQLWMNNGANAEVVTMAFSQLYVKNY